MKTLKKVLAATLACAMTLTMLAGAAFTDSADVKATEAVNTLVALNVIKGQSDGSFNPDGNVTRAELAKMIYVVKNAGNDDGASYYAGLGTNFTDVKGHWAEGYIKYAASLGIINGRSATKFDPNAPVTGLEASKMLLVTAGYKADKEGLVGTQWAIKAASLGSEVGLFEDVQGSLTSSVSRQYAAQMIYNLLDANTVNYNSVLGDGAIVNDGNNYTKNETVGGKYMNLQSYTGVLQSSGKVNVLNGTGTGTVGAAKEKLVVDVTAIDGKDVKTTADGKGPKAFDFATDSSKLIGQEVKVIANTKNDTVYGVYSTDENEIAIDAVAGDVEKKDTKKVKYDGVEYTLEDKVTKVVVESTANTVVTKTEDVAAATVVTDLDNDNTGNVVTLISNDGDENVDTVIYYKNIVKKVTYVGSDNMTIETVGNKDFDDMTMNEVKFAKDDFAVVGYDLYNNQLSLTKADKVEGKITSTKSSGTEFKVGDVWYTIATNDTVDTDKKITAYAYNGYVYDVDTTGASSTDFLTVLSFANSTDVNGKYQTKVVTNDGTVKVVSAIQKSSTGFDAKPTKGLHYFEMDGDDYKLTPAADYSISGTDFDGRLTAGNYNNKKLVDGSTTTYIADDATIFVAYDYTAASPKSKVMTGAEFKSSLGDRDYTKTGYTDNAKVIYGYYETSNGVNYAKVALVSFDNDSIPGGATSNYGYVVSDVETVKVDNTNYKKFTIWNGSENVDVKVKSTDSDMSASKGDFIKYDVDGDVIDVTATVAKATAAAVYGYEKSSEEINFLKNDGSTTGMTEFDDDIVILYVNTKDKKGVSGGSINKADEVTDGVFTKNVVYVIESGKVVFIAADVSNKIDGSTSIDTNPVASTVATLKDVASKYTVSGTGAARTLTLDSVGSATVADLEKTDAKATITNVTDTTNSDDKTADATYVLVAGDTVTVTAEDGTTVIVYTVA